MNFSRALERVKDGDKIGRQGWNGKGMYVEYVGPSIGLRNELYDAFLQMKTVQGTLVPWLASQTDILAEDWEIVNA